MFRDPAAAVRYLYCSDHTKKAVPQTAAPPHHKIFIQL